MIIFDRGSEWRKWDLHIHTPASVLCNNFGDWDSYVKELFSKAISLGIHGIGITDYYIPEGYKILKTQYLDNPSKLQSLFPDSADIERIKRIFVFPNIEFRLSKMIIGKQRDLSWNRKLNYHVLLSNELSIDDIESNFINQLSFKIDSGVGEKTESRPLNIANLESFGRSLISDHPEFGNHNALYVGMMNASIDEDQIAEKLNSNSLFSNKYLFGLPADEDLSDVEWNSGGHSARKNLIKQSHFIFSSNPRTRNFLLGGANKEAFVREFGGLKACLWGSDAHELDKLFIPFDERHTWIKADLNFNGLKQVIYDPESRSKIQPHNPQQKSSYQIISRVRFVDTANGGRFSPDWININPDLNTIIGGKSSGKSLLLYHIAKSINSIEVDEKVRISQSSSYSNLAPNSGFDFEVEWANGDISRLSSLREFKPITYIPQLYINHLAEQNGKQQLNDLIRNLLSQNENFKSFLDLKEQEISNYSQLINAKIGMIFAKVDSYKSIKLEMDQIGVKLAVDAEVKNLKTQIEELRRKSGFSSDEEAAYKDRTLRLSDLQRRKGVLETIQKYTTQFHSSTINNASTFKQTNRAAIFSELFVSTESKFVEKLIIEFESKVDKALQEFKKYSDDRVSQIPTLIEILDAKITAVQLTINPFLSRISDKNILDVASKKLILEEEKFKKILEKETKLISIKEQGNTLRTELNELYNLMVTSYKNIADQVASSEYQLGEEIRISAEVTLLEDVFSEFTKSFDARGNLKPLLEELINDNREIQFDINEHAKIISGIAERLKRKESLPAIRKGITDEELTRRLFSNCLSINYMVHYRGDEIVLMSPGKRGLVLLNLLLHLSNASHPILIDQPEDNLDNRTIYEQLNAFIRDRKPTRQIIIVTHNANLVVSADAECVIVANQAGQRVNADNEKYTFEYRGGSLEESFEDNSQPGLLRKKGIRQHVCEVLEGGVTAFKEREIKYGFKH